MSPIRRDRPNPNKPPDSFGTVQKPEFPQLRFPWGDPTETPRRKTASLPLESRHPREGAVDELEKFVRSLQYT